MSKTKAEGMRYLEAVKAEAVEAETQWALTRAAHPVEMAALEAAYAAGDAAMAEQQAIIEAMVASPGASA